MKIEYQVFIIDTRDPLKEQLNAIGEEGWIVIQLLNQTRVLCYREKRGVISVESLKALTDNGIKSGVM